MEHDAEQNEFYFNKQTAADDQFDDGYRNSESTSAQETPHDQRGGRDRMTSDNNSPFQGLSAALAP